jgi:Ni/Co efflux regulator RcnB
MNGRSIAACALALTFFAVSGKVAVAQDRGQDRRPGANRDQDRRAIQADQDRKAMQGRHSFNDRDRQVTRDWYQRNQRHVGSGWRQRDRLSPAMQARLRRGQRLDPTLRREMHSLPPDLYRQYGPAPRGYRYVIIGGNIVMIDDAYQVQDVFTLTLNF